MPALIPSLVVVAMSAASLAPAATRPPSAVATLDVPYLPQTDALCGGAAAAMVFRFWGDAHADVRAFAPLVDRRRGGIEQDVLVGAIVSRGWRAEAGPGSLDALRAHLAAGEPTIVLVEDRPARYHYVVVIGADEDAAIVHDPAWGPARRIRNRDLIAVWRPAGFWSLVIRPSPTGIPREDAAAPAPAHVASVEDAAGREACDRLLAAAVDEVGRRGLASADELLGAVRTRCPSAAGPLRELAGVRFAERRWREAAALAGQAAARDPGDEYAWDVLGSSRYMQDDAASALEAWNRIGKPRIDRVRIEGLTRARYALVAELVDLPTGALLTAERFRRAERRLRALPDAAAARLAFRPRGDGYAIVDIAIAEQPTRPRGPVAWSAEAARAAVNREVRAALAGATGQGESWSLGWRWWEDRPRIALAFAAPSTGVVGGVWRLEASWERQSFRVGEAGGGQIARDERTHAALSTSDWLTAGLRYRVGAGLDSWTGRGHTIAVNGGLERRAWGDRIRVGAGLTRWMAVGEGAAFGSVAGFGAYRSSPIEDGFVLSVDTGIDRVSSGAPYDVWPGAGEGQARAALLRAHPLLDAGIVAGPAFGRRLEHATGEARRWLDLALPVRVGVALFADAAHASQTIAGAPLPVQVDVGGGLRLRVPGVEGVLRVDVAQALRDRARAVTVGVQTAWR